MGRKSVTAASSLIFDVTRSSYTAFRMRAIIISLPSRQLPTGVADCAIKKSVNEKIKDKIKGRESLIRERERLRREGKQVVFTNGCFDLLHPGHIRYLSEARALGDALIVALNSDRSVRSLKGEGRPVLNEEERSEVMAALECVSFVTVFDQETPRELIAALLPDVLVKGGDWAIEKIVGRQEVEAAGGKVLSLKYVEGSSTTDIIERIRNSKG